MVAEFDNRNESEHALPPDEEWRLKAECRTAPHPGVFYPLKGHPEAAALTKIALAYCGRCVVTRECLAWALENGKEEGIWGGKTEEERKLMSGHNQTV